MYIAADHGLVRIVHDGSPFDVAYDIRVEWRENPDSEWTLYKGINSLSDDYAHTTAREAAARASAILARRHV